jgi:hypothetical protein
LNDRTRMKRTLLAIGLAVLVSMMVAPRGKSGDSYMPFFIHGWPYYVSEYKEKVQRSRTVSADEASNLPECSPGITWFTSTSGCLEPDYTRDSLNPYLRLVPVPRRVYYGETVVRPAHWGWTSIEPVALDRLALQTVFLATLFAVLANIRWRRKV